MNRAGPPGQKEKSGPARNRSQDAPQQRLLRAAACQSRLTAQLLNLIQAPFGFVFWLIEQRKARLSDELERRQT
jgi:hypothetical protein